MLRLPRPSGEADLALRELIRQGFGRRLEGDEVIRMESTESWPKSLDPLPLVLGRFQAKGEATAQLAAAFEEGYRLNRERVEARGEAD